MKRPRLVSVRDAGSPSGTLDDIAHCSTKRAGGERERIALGRSGLRMQHRDFGARNRHRRSPARPWRLCFRRLLPAVAQRLVGPFTFFDHMGPAEFAVGRASMCDPTLISGSRR